MAKLKGLGKGLEALMPNPIESSIDINNRSFIDIDIHQIKPNPLQPRKSFNEDNIEALAESIRRNGILQPLILRPIRSGYEIIAGERRFRASKVANLDTVPAIIMNPDEQELYEIALIENMQRVDLNPIEEALAFNALKERFDMTQLEVAKVVGKSRAYVANAIRLLNLDEIVKTSVITGAITSGHAVMLISLPREIQRQLTEHIINDGLSVRELEKRVKNYKNPVKREKGTESNDYIYYDTYIKKMEDVLGTKVRISLNGTQNKLSLSFIDGDDFERIYNLITKISVK